MPESKVTIHARRLLADHRFQAIRQQTQADPANVKVYVRKARQEHNLSDYWDELLPIMLLNNFDPAMLAGGAVIESKVDPVTGKVSHRVNVAEEATLSDVKRAYTVIRGREKLANRRYSGRYEQEFRVLELREANKTIPEIIEILKAEFNRDYDAADIASFMQKARQKAKP